MPTFYQCQRCTACCRWPGQVKLNDGEISRMAAYLQLSEEDFIQEYTRVRPDRRGLALKDKTNHECILLEGSNCRVQAVKPQQCRDFPNLWNFPGFEDECQAVALSLDDEEYRRRIKEATGRELPGNESKTA